MLLTFQVDFSMNIESIMEKEYFVAHLQVE